MLRILYGLMIMTISKEDTDTSGKIKNWYHSSPIIKVSTTLYHDVTLFCNRIDVSWWKRTNLRSSERQLISTRNGKIMKAFGSKYALLVGNNDHERSELLVKNATVHDEGYYECECIHRGTGKQDETIDSPARYHIRYKLEVIAPVSSVHLYAKSKGNKSSFLQATDNDDVPVSCTARGVKPRAEIGFVPHNLLNGKMVTWKADSNGLFTTTLSGQIHIRKSLHGQLISCWAHNRLANVSSDQLKIVVYSKPKCTTDQITLINVSVGSSILINCTMIDTYPAVDKFHWELGPNARYDQGKWSQNSAFIMAKISLDMVYSTVSCTGRNSVGSGVCLYQLQLGGVPDPPFGCSSTQTNTTLTISCKAGFHQGDPDYFCYLELFHKDTQQFVEIARKKQSCVFLLTEFRPKGLHTYRLYTENKHGSNKADSIIIRIGEETMKPNNRWKALSISLGVLAGLSAVAILCFIVYRIVVPFTHATTFNSLIEPNRDPYVDDHKLVDRMYASSLSTRRGSLTMGRYLRNNPLDCDECGRPNSQMISHASNKRPRSFPINNELSQSTDELTREKSSDLPFPLQRRCSDNRGYSSSIADSCLHTGNKSLTLDNVNAQCRPCKYALYNPTRSEDVLCENGQHRQLLSRHLTPGNNGTNIMATSHTRHLLVTQQSQNIKFHPENPNAPSRRCDDGGVFV